MGSPKFDVRIKQDMIEDIMDAEAPNILERIAEYTEDPEESLFYLIFYLCYHAEEYLGLNRASVIGVLGWVEHNFVWNCFNRDNPDLFSRDEDA